MTAAISKQEDRLDGHHDRLLRLEVRDGMDETTKIRRMDR